MGKSGYQAEDLTDRRFGRFLVKRRAANRGRMVMWTCECDCGARRDIWASDLRRRGDLQSCGCLRSELVTARFTKHGLSGTSIHGIWIQMRKRCADLNDQLYGAMGVRVCVRWEESFDAFMADIGGARPSPAHSLDRYPDRNGHYEPGNVRWATDKQQQRNKRNNRMLEFRGETLCIPDWADRTDLTVACIRARVFSLGWSIERALTVPKQERA